MHVDRQGIDPHDVLNRLLAPLLADRQGLRLVDVAAGVGHVAVAVGEAGDPHTGATAEDLDAHVPVLRVVTLRPGLRDIDHRIGTLDAHDLVRRTGPSFGPATAGDRRRNRAGKEQNNKLACHGGILPEVCVVRPIESNGRRRLYTRRASAKKGAPV